MRRRFRATQNGKEFYAHGDAARPGQRVRAKNTLTPRIDALNRDEGPRNNVSRANPLRDLTDPTAFSLLCMSHFYFTCIGLSG